MLGLASAAAGYGFNAASSYMYSGSNGASGSARTDVSTSKSSAAPQSPRQRRGSSTNRSSSSSTSSPNGGRVSRPSHHRRSSHLPSASTSPHGKGKRSTSSADSEARKLVDSINEEEDLYRILGLSNGKKAKQEEVRRAFLGRSRICHPDKLPDYPPATAAFQRLSYAYETLSKPSSRRLYDLGGGGRGAFDPGSPGSATTTAMGDETLNGVLRNVFTEFMSGDFDMIRTFVNALNEGNPGLNLGDETIDNLEGAFRRVREVVLSGQKYLRLIRFELIRLYQLQLDLRSLSYFDLVGRLRLTLALTRVTLEIPMVLDRAMREEVVVRRPPGAAARTGRAEEEEEPGQESWAEWSTADGGAGTGEAGELQRRGLLGPRVKGVLVLACKVLEKGERFGL